MERRAVFLDRDGVLNDAVVKNDKPYPPSNIDEVVIPVDVLPALNRLKDAGFLLIVVTNQPDVSRGKTKQAIVEVINSYLKEILPLDDVRVCYHDDKDACHCRKPKGGLLIDAAADYDIKLSKSFMIGDRWKDIAAGHAAGVKTIWLKKGYQEDDQSDVSPDIFKATMTESVNWIISQL